MSTESTAPTALTTLTDEERMFRDTVRDFAQGEIQPRVAAMETAKRHDPELLKSLFEMGLMGIDVDEAHGGAGCSFFQAILVSWCLVAQGRHDLPMLFP